jgi:hypothetical protein
MLSAAQGCRKSRTAGHAARTASTSRARAGNSIAWGRHSFTISRHIAARQRPPARSRSPARPRLATISNESTHVGSTLGDCHAEAPSLSQSDAFRRLVDGIAAALAFAPKAIAAHDDGLVLHHRVAFLRRSAGVSLRLIASTTARLFDEGRTIVRLNDRFARAAEHSLQ